jgi:lysophospholipase L1-like esterase
MKAKNVFAWVLVMALVGLVGAATSTVAAKTPASKPAARAQSRNETDAVTPSVKNPERHAKFLEQAKAGNCGLLFLGDSITDGWPRGGKESWALFAKYKPLDFGISGDRTEHVLYRITNGELAGIKHKGVVIMIGTNNIGHFADEKPEWAAAGVKKIVDVVREKQPQAKILLLGVFPRDKKDSPHRNAVDAINAIICKLDDGANVKYLDIGGKFLDDKGESPPEIMKDKLHPSAKGYQIWADAILPVLEEMMK